MKHFSAIIIFLFVNLCLGQKFEEGYFIENSGTKVECLLNKSYQYISPDVIRYKLPESDEVKEISCNAIKEMGINDKVVYYKYKVDVDLSSNKMSDLDTEKKLNTIQKEVLLELVENGKIKLFAYNASSDKSSYYLLKEGDDFPQLLDYKKYRSEVIDQIIKENNDFRNEIYNYVKDANIEVSEVEKLSYRESEIQKIIRKYNVMNNSSVESNLKKDSFGKFCIKPRLSLLNSKLEFSNKTNTSFSSNSVFDPQTSFGFGVDLEIEMMSGFSIFLSPNYGTFKGTSTQTIYGVSAANTVIETKVDYQFLRNYLGVRKYFEITNKNNVHIGVNGVFDFVLNNKTQQVFHPEKINFSNSFDIGFNLGYNFNKKYFLELNYDLKRNLSPNYETRVADYSNFSVSVMYNILGN